MCAGAVYWSGIGRTTSGSSPWPALPEVVEDQWYRSPAYQVAGRGSLRLRTEAEGRLVVFVPDEGEKQALLAADPGAFSTTPTTTGTPWCWSTSPRSTGPS